jgi:hypothetical protein
MPADGILFEHGKEHATVSFQRIPQFHGVSYFLIKNIDILKAI